MNLFTGESSDEYFGSEAPPAVRRLLSKALQANANEREALLWTAQATAPSCLATYYLLYKFHAQQRDFELAERAARKGLGESARQAGLPDDCFADVPQGIDFNVNGPARFWLFTLKALAFIYLRDGRLDEARQLVARINALDPLHTVGADVIAALLRHAGP